MSARRRGENPGATSEGRPTVTPVDPVATEVMLDTRYDGLAAAVEQRSGALATVRTRDACSARLTELLVERALRGFAHARFGAPDASPTLAAMRQAFDRIESIYLERSAHGRIAIDPEQNALAARRTITAAYRGLLKERHLDDDLLEDQELVSLASAAAARVARDVGLMDVGGGEPIGEERAGAVDIAWLLRISLTVRVLAVQLTSGFLGLSFEDDEIYLDGTAVYEKQAGGQGTGRAERPLDRYFHTFSEDGEPHAIRPDMRLDQVQIEPGTSVYRAVHLLFESDLFEPGGKAAGRLAGAVAQLVSLGLDFAIAFITNSLDKLVDDERDPDKKERNRQIREGFNRFRESEAFKDANDALEGALEQFLKDVFEDDAFQTFSTRVDIMWDPPAEPVWDTSLTSNFDFLIQQAILDRLQSELEVAERALAAAGADTSPADRQARIEDVARARARVNEQRAMVEQGPTDFGVPSRVTGRGASLLEDIVVNEVDGERGRYVLDLKYEMIPVEVPRPA